VRPINNAITARNLKVVDFPEIEIETSGQSTIAIILYRLAVFHPSPTSLIIIA
jgi:hypothetical protein